MPRAKKEPKPKKPFLSGYRTYDPKKEGYGNVNQWRAAWKAMNHEEAVAVLQDDDPLVVMGFSSMPTKADLDSRFHTLVKQHHPDHGGDAEMFKKVYAAWSELCRRCQ